MLGLSVNFSVRVRVCVRARVRVSVMSRVRVGLRVKFKGYD